MIRLVSQQHGVNELPHLRIHARQASTVGLQTIGDGPVTTRRRQRQPILPACKASQDAAVNLQVMLMP